MPDADEDDGGLSARWALILAVVVLLLVRMLVPFGREMLYPFTLLATWVHEMGHGLTALAMGGELSSLDIFWNGSGLAHTSGVAGGWPRALVSIGGLLAPPVVGASILAFARGPKRATIALGVLAGLMLISVPLWIRSLTGLTVIPGVAALLALLAVHGGATLKHVAAQGLGVLLGLDAVFGLDYLFTSSATIDGRELPSDVANVAAGAGGHWLLWGVVLALISIGLVAIGLRVAWMSPLALPKLKWPKKRKDVTSSRGGRSNL